MRRKLLPGIFVILLSLGFLVAFRSGISASALPREAPPADGGTRQPATTLSLDPPSRVAPNSPSSSVIARVAAGHLIEVFTNTWASSTLGFVYDPVRDRMRYVHESQPYTTVFDIQIGAPHAVLGSYSLSVVNTGWPADLDNRTGAGFDPTSNTFFLPDYNGDLSNADDNIVEVMPDGTILNAWEMDDEVGSNDSSDGTSIDSIIDIAVVPGSPTRYFATAAYDGNVVYEIALAKTGTWWTPNSWSTVMTCSVPGLTDNLGIDYDATTGRLFHSGWQTDTLVVTDLSCTPEVTFTCASNAGYNSGVAYIEGSHPPEVWVTNFSNDQTTRCEAPGQTPDPIAWGKTVDGVPWVPDLAITRETSDTIEVVDVFTSTQPLELVESWDPLHLELIGYVTQPAVGNVITGPSHIRWEMPPYPSVMTTTKHFHVRPSTWTTAAITEVLFLHGGVHLERPFTVTKRLPNLWLESQSPPYALAGSVVTYTLRYGNVGGYENDVSVISTFPITAPYLHANPAPDHIAPGVVVWNVGDLADGDIGQIEVWHEIAPTVDPTETVEINAEIRNHVGQVADDAAVSYDVEAPPDVTWLWDKWIDGESWDPGITVTTETSDTIMVVDELQVNNDALLIERWDPAHLELVGLDISTGSVSTATGELRWEVEVPPDYAIITKTFHVRSCVWVATEVWEELLIDPGAGYKPVEVRPVFVIKRPSELWIDHDVSREVAPGQLAEFVLRYGNRGGLESSGWITGTFPPEAGYHDALPKPDGVDPNGRWARWDLGALAEGEEHAITVTVEITRGLTPSMTIPIYGYILDHADIERDWTAIHYHVAPPIWEKRVQGVDWYDGISTTVQTGDVIEVVDVIAGPFNTRLVELWNPERLTLLDATPSFGHIITDPAHLDSLEWLVPYSGPEVVTLTKRFRIMDCAWTHSLLQEVLWVEGLDWQRRPTVVYKPPADLWMTADYPADVFPGEHLTYTLNYGNTGGPESRAWVTATFPITAPFAGASPAPDAQDPHRRWARWDIGALEPDDQGTIAVSVAVSPTAHIYDVIHTQNYVYDHIDVERVWTPITMTLQPALPQWEKEIWINHQGPYSVDAGPFNVVAGDRVTIIDHVHITAAMPVSYTLAEVWAPPLSLSAWAVSSGTVLTTAQTLTWHGWNVAPNTVHMITKTLVVGEGNWDASTVTETLMVAEADPTTHQHVLAFERGRRRVFLPLVTRNYGP